MPRRRTYLQGTPAALRIDDLRLKCIECGSQSVGIGGLVPGGELDQSRRRAVARQPIPAMCRAERELRIGGESSNAVHKVDVSQLPAFAPLQDRMRERNALQSSTANFMEHLLFAPYFLVFRRQPTLQQFGRLRLRFNYYNLQILRFTSIDQMN